MNGAQRKADTRQPSTGDSSVDNEEGHPTHAYCGLPGAERGPPGYLGTDPHQAGWLAGKWTASADDAERVDALRKLGILLTVRVATTRAMRVPRARVPRSSVWPIAK